MKTNELKELAERLRESGVPTHFEEDKARLFNRSLAVGGSRTAGDKK